MGFEQVARRFGLGRPVAAPVRVPGGLSNELWRLTTTGGVFAVKRMVVNAGRPDFVANVEASFAVELRAWRAGVPMPEPVPDAGCALASVDGSWFRVHRWVPGRAGMSAAGDAAGLLAAIHAAGDPRWAPAPDFAWDGARWGADVAGLARRVAGGPGRVLLVDSHGDLDRKNTLLSAEGVLMAVDWDAAGPVGAVQEAASLALDWSDGSPQSFAEAVRAYTRCSGLIVPAEPWVFAAWVAGQGGWLDYSGTPEPLVALRAVAARLDVFLAALPSPPPG